MNEHLFKIAHGLFVLEETCGVSLTEIADALEGIVISEEEKSEILQFLYNLD